MKVIAESAFNHNGSIDYLLSLALAAKNSDADYFTVQVMDANEFSVKKYSKYQIYIDNEIKKDDWIKLFDYCKELKLEVIPCILDENSFDLCYKYGFRFFKIHATDICNEPFLKYIVSKGDCKLILETQVATNFDILFATKILGESIECLITGYSNYPTEVEDLNLNVLESLKKDYKYKIGFADHSLDIDCIPLMLLAKGCDYIEKHITISRNNRNFDWQVSLYPEQFKAMVSTINYYTKALGNGVKHPVKNELPYRTIMYKKVVGEKVLRRADEGLDYLSNEFKSFDKKNVTIGLIARLKSQRLPLKVLKPFCSEILIVDLYNRINECKNISSVFLATSYLQEDKDLADVGYQKGLKVFLGHPVSVIDRLLGLAYQEKAGGIFRVTGDNPFTDPNLIDKMVDLFVKNDLDYVRVNNVPFGVSAELFSVNYLWNLYLKMANPMNSEYLSWFVLNDIDAKKGAIDFESDKLNVNRVNLSIDYPEDYTRSMDLLKKIGKSDLKKITLKDIVENVDLNDIEPEDKIIKLPSGDSILFKDYLSLIYNANYIVREKFKL